MILANLSSSSSLASSIFFCLASSFSASFCFFKASYSLFFGLFFSSLFIFFSSLLCKFHFSCHGFFKSLLHCFLSPCSLSSSPIGFILLKKSLTFKTHLLFLSFHLGLTCFSNCLQFLLSKLILFRQFLFKLLLLQLSSFCISFLLFELGFPLFISCLRCSLLSI